MKIKYIFLEGNIITGAGFGSELPDGAVEVKTALSIRELTQGMIVAGVITPRPQSGVVSMITGGCLVADCPAGSWITVFDLSGGEQMGRIEWDSVPHPVEILMPDAGEYRIEVDGPLPFLPNAVKVVIFLPVARKVVI